MKTTLPYVAHPVLSLHISACTGSRGAPRQFSPSENKTASSTELPRTKERRVRWWDWAVTLLTSLGGGHMFFSSLNCKRQSKATNKSTQSETLGDKASSSSAFITRFKLYSSSAELSRAVHRVLSAFRVAVRMPAPNKRQETRPRGGDAGDVFSQSQAAQHDSPRPITSQTVKDAVIHYVSASI